MSKDLLLKEMTEWNKYNPLNLLSRLDQTIKEKEGKASNDDVGLAGKAFQEAKSLENLQLLTNVVSERYKAYTYDLVKSIEKDFKCKSTAERLMAHTVVNAYIRILEYSDLHRAILKEEKLGREKAQVYSTLGKEVDRAYKQFSSTIALFIQMKSKPINVRIKTQNALFGQNQQLNLNSRDNLSEKVIEPN